MMPGEDWDELISEAPDIQKPKNALSV